MRRILLGCLAFASVAHAQTPPAPAGGDEIVVKGRSGPVVRSYVERVGKPEPGHQLTRWNAAICVKYDDVAPQFASFIQQRLTRIGATVGVKVLAPGCTQTAVLIKLTDQADAWAKALVHMNPPRIGSVTSDRLLPKREIEALEAPHTVRWLTTSATVSHDGVPIVEGANKIWSVSLIRSATREDVASKIVLIDAVRLKDVSLNQLADYIAFVTLASPDVAADFSDTDSIMALFAGGHGPPPAGLTHQDRSFLEALYTGPADRSAHEQRNTIRSRIMEGKAGRRN